MNCTERNIQFKEKMIQVSELMDEIKNLADMRYDSEKDDLFMLYNFGSHGDIYERMKEACKHYGIE